MSDRRRGGAARRGFALPRLLGMLALALLVGISGLDAAHAAGHDQAQALHPYLSDGHHGTAQDAPHTASDGGDCHGVLLCHTVVEAAAGSVWRVAVSRRGVHQRTHDAVDDLAAPDFDPPPPRRHV